MKNTFNLIILFCFLTFLSSVAFKYPHWGFHAHQIINKMAVFILPPEMMVFYKKNIDFISTHATDPDKRRYAVSGEAIKHYMDMEHWGTHPYNDAPNNYTDAMFRYTQMTQFNETGDSLILKSKIPAALAADSLMIGTKQISNAAYKKFIKQKLLYNSGSNPWRFPADSINIWLGLSLESEKLPWIIIEEDFSQYGICPYHITNQYYQLVAAFRRSDHKSILRISTDMGHYVADAHVPLHTTSNYNGQLTNQHGIHAFWESRLPELYANVEYDYIVGKARFISDIENFIWNTILESNLLLSEVLDLEKALSQSFRDDQKFTYEIRLGKTTRIQSQEYSNAYHLALDGMVEKRMQDAVLALGSIWFTAWVNAGQPVLEKEMNLQWTREDLKQMEIMDFRYSAGDPQGRSCK